MRTAGGGEPVELGLRETLIRGRDVGGHRDVVDRRLAAQRGKHGKGQLAKSNAEQVRKVRQIVEGLGLEPATPDEARSILGLKGGDKVDF